MEFPRFRGHRALPLVRWSRMHRLRLLVSRSDGTVPVQPEIQKVASKNDVLQPVRASLGLGVAEAISLGGKTVVVEGFADDYYVDSMRRHCTNSGVESLPDDVTILVAGGAGKKMLPLASFMAASG